MGRITEVTMAHPDEVLMLAGFIAGFVFGFTNIGLLGGVLNGLLFALFSIMVASIEPIDPSRGPHQ